MNWEFFAETGMINPDDLKLFKFCDTVDEAYDFITSKLEEQSEETVTFARSHAEDEGKKK